jgi:hypothetical protein
MSLFQGEDGGSIPPCAVRSGQAQFVVGDMQ